MIASALQVAGLAAVCVALWLISTIAGIAAVGVSCFAVGFVMEAR